MILEMQKKFSVFGSIPPFFHFVKGSVGGQIHVAIWTKVMCGQKKCGVMSCTFFCGSRICLYDTGYFFRSVFYRDNHFRLLDSGELNFIH